MKKIVFGLLALLIASTAIAGSEPYPTTIFVRGGFNDWGNGPAPTSPMTWNEVDQEYTATIFIDAGEWDFKIADGDWGGLGGPNFGAGGNDPNVVLDIVSAIGDDCCTNLHLSLTQSSNYLFTFFNIDLDLMTGELLVTKVIPIPAAGLLLLSAVGGLGFLRRRRAD